MIEPVKSPVITSPYGMRMLQGKRQFHNGIDFISGEGDARVMAITSGIVVYDMDDYIPELRWRNRKHSAGNYVIIKHRIKDAWYYFRYLHLGENYLSLNEEVSAGQVIGKYADAGISYGAHLHMGAFDEKWRRVNPTPLVQPVLPEVAA